MAITQALCTSFKQEVLEGVHNFALSGGDTFKMALYATAATLDASTTAYSSSNEVTGAGYTAGGVTLTRLGTDSGSGKGYAAFDDVTFSTVTVTARGALIYNSSKSNKAVAVLDFGAEKTATAGDLIVYMPDFTAADSIVRIE